VVSIVLQPPRTEQRLRKNPLGIYVNGLSWSRELEAKRRSKTMNDLFRKSALPVILLALLFGLRHAGQAAAVHLAR
jgi:hypothetical protein